MRFVLENEREGDQPTFEDVEVGQFFIDADGDLMQKLDYNSANRIANKNGTPDAIAGYPISPTRLINRILPRVSRIDF